MIVVLKPEDAGGDGGLGRELGRGERLALEDGEEDLDLVDPTGMRGQVKEGEVLDPAPEPVDGSLPTSEGTDASPLSCIEGLRSMMTRDDAR